MSRNHGHSNLGVEIFSGMPRISQQPRFLFGLIRAHSWLKGLVA